MNTNLLNRIMESRGEFPPENEMFIKRFYLKMKVYKRIKRTTFYNFVVVDRIGVKCLSPHFSFCIRIIKPC